MNSDPQRCAQVIALVPVKVTLFGIGVFAGVISGKDPEMRLSHETEKKNRDTRGEKVASRH